MRELFVWYRVDDGKTVAAAQAVEAMQRRLMDEVDGLAARLLVRTDAGAGASTWMEVYVRPGHAQGIDAAMEAAIAAAAESLAPLIDGARHVEAFTPLPVQR